MIVGEIVELKILDVYDRGVPNRERIAVFANQAVDMGQFGLMIGVRGSGGSAVPIRDNLLWFGDGILDTGDVILVYTGPGEPRVSTLPNNRQKLITVHWGRLKVLFSDQNFVPILFRVDAVMIPADQPEARLLAPPG
jgi:hypothetical protein